MAPDVTITTSTPRWCSRATWFASADITSRSRRADSAGTAVLSAGGPAVSAPNSSLHASPTSSQTSSGNAAGTHNAPDVALMALLTIGAAGAAAVLGLIGYVIRNRVGFWPHR